MLTSGTDTIPIAPIERPLEDGWTLPADWYSDAGVYALERERIFDAAWHYAGPLEWVVDRGCFFSAQIGHVPVAVVRGSDGTLRGFVNVCRHRGHLVVEGEGCRETLQCPYHAWTYDLDGRLRKAPRSEREPGFDPAGFSLLPVSVGTWGPFVFVNPDPDAAPLEDALGGLPAIVARSGIDLETIRFHSHHEWPIAANWKIAMENFLECYHCPTAHPGFSKVIDVAPDEYRLQVHATLLDPARLRSSRGPRRRRARRRTRLERTSPRRSTTSSSRPRRSTSPREYPNIGLERYIPDGAARTIEVTDYYFGPEASSEEIEELMAWDSQVGQEDVSLVESVQRGLDSGTVPQGRLMTESEQLITDFQRRVRDALLT